MAVRGVPWDSVSNPTPTYFSPTLLVKNRGTDITMTQEGVVYKLPTTIPGTLFGVSNQLGSLYSLSFLVKLNLGTKTVHVPPGRGIDFLMTTSGFWKISAGDYSVVDGEIIVTSGLWDGNTVDPVSTPYDLTFFYKGIPEVDEVLGRLYVARDVGFEADFSGSGGDILVNPTSQFNIDVQDDGVSIGTISINTGGVFSFTTTGNTAKAVASGSILTFIGPNPADATAEDISITLAGSI